MELIGYCACALIGISLGLIGAGGSILMVPVLVFLFRMPPVLATSYSLFVVGITSFFAATGKFRKGDVLVGSALTFGLTSMVAVVAIRQFVIPIMPKSFGHLGHATLSYDLLSIVLFACLMILAAIVMINKSGKTDCVTMEGSSSFMLSIPYALLIGTVTGFLGAGGGFILIPVMTLMLGMDIKKAVGTSLAVVALNSLSGFANDLNHVDINWKFLLVISAMALLGSIAGARIADRVNSKKLKAGFGWFILMLGILIITRECYSFFQIV
ncbi:sulfite exporter TauE/SafE family protein [Pedobacter frigoris]|uniref:Probable membrane transporter protein n=1 Tax=Pedobacter frigoris TaxID=2571272 RepID=A0A4U1CQJ7_9SPHI|nr:sulfite exporter TauE/SafE family protein [Pedobacter frigoris]TKC09170.1 sulfite exporter TauE/SafE family protein [Pedobacter frigoris]